MKQASLFALFVLCGVAAVLVGSGVIDLHDPAGAVHAAPGATEMQLQYGVAGSGGGDMTSASYGVSGTAGQTAAGNSASTSYEGSAGYWNSILATATGAGSPSDAPRDYSLAQNYPNPFNPTTTIQFAIPERGRVKLRVYDVSGNLVATLVDQDLPAGVHDALWDARGIASGVYFCQIEATGFVRTKKLVLLK